MRFRVSRGARRSGPFPRRRGRGRGPSRSLPPLRPSPARTNAGKSFNWLALLCQQNGLLCSITEDSLLLVMGEPEKTQCDLHITGSSLAHCPEDKTFWLIRSLY